MKISATLACVGAIASALTLSPASAMRADGAWLDESFVNWNAPGQTIPTAPAAPSAMDPRCERLHRPTETPEDEAVAAAGWTVFGTYQSGWGVRVVHGLVAHDGMCRPLGYQEFVFVNGVFAGTISPTPMNARTDGAETSTDISAPGENVQAQFVRYTDADAFCCPSRTSSVAYRINQDGGMPVLVPGAVYTTPSGQ
jgi:LppP/LprE lipoprotein